MEQINTNKEYNEYVKQKSPNSPILKDCFNAFWVGGLICSIGQIILDFCMFKEMDNTMAQNWKIRWCWFISTNNRVC